MVYDEVAGLYDRLRPRYPSQLFADLVSLAGVERGACILEVGAGSGIATLPLAERGHRILAVELGRNLARIAQQKLAAFPNVTIMVDDFDVWEPPPAAFHLVVGASSFHWLDPVTRLHKAARALKPGGALALALFFHIAGGDDRFFWDVQACYRRHMPDADLNFVLPSANDYRANRGAVDYFPDAAEIEATALFDLPTVKTYTMEVTYKLREYLDLLQTYSRHHRLRGRHRTDLLACIERLIEGDFGGKIRKRYLAELMVARRRESSTTGR